MFFAEPESRLSGAGPSHRSTRERVVCSNDCAADCGFCVFTYHKAVYHKVVLEGGFSCIVEVYYSSFNTQTPNEIPAGPARISTDTIAVQSLSYQTLIEVMAGEDNAEGSAIAGGATVEMFDHDVKEVSIVESLNAVLRRVMTMRAGKTKPGGC